MAMNGRPVVNNFIEAVCVLHSETAWTPHSASLSYVGHAWQPQKTSDPNGTVCSASTYHRCSLPLSRPVSLSLTGEASMFTR